MWRLVNSEIIACGCFSTIRTSNIFVTSTTIGIDRCFRTFEIHMEMNFPRKSSISLKTTVFVGVEIVAMCAEINMHTNIRNSNLAFHVIHIRDFSRGVILLA